MAESYELSPSGDPIYRYNSPPKPFQIGIGDIDNIRQIEAHIEKYIGKPETVFHEILSDIVHIDVHFVPASQQRNFHTLVTSGMSDLPMKTPDAAAEFRYAELMISLPPDWPIDQESFKSENVYWPIRSLKFLARFPHKFDTWLGAGHTIPNGDPPENFADTEFCCMMLMPSLCAPRGIRRLELPDRVVHFYTLWPLYREEMEHKLRHGSGSLLDRLSESPETSPEKVEIVTINRPNSCRR